MTKCSCRTSGDSSPHFCRPIFRSRPSWFQEYFLATPPPPPTHTHTHTHTHPPPHRYKIRRPPLIIYETKVAERRTRFFFSPTSCSIETVPKRSLFWGFGLSRGISRGIHGRSTAGRQEVITYKIRPLNLSKWCSPCIVNLKKVNTLSNNIKKKKTQTKRRLDCIYASWKGILMTQASQLPPTNSTADSSSMD